MKLKLICRNCKNDEFKFMGENEWSLFYECTECNFVHEFNDFSMTELKEE